jgi:hypothetical protein
VLCARLVDVFSPVPVGVLLVGNGYDLADAEIEVVLVARGVVIQGLDLERHDDAARGQLRSQLSGVEARWKLWRGFGELELPKPRVAAGAQLWFLEKAQERGSKVD